MKFKVILGYVVDLRLAWDTCDPISELLLFQKRRGMAFQGHGGALLDAVPASTQ